MKSPPIVNRIFKFLSQTFMLPSKMQDMDTDFEENKDRTEDGARLQQSSSNSLDDIRKYQEEVKKRINEDETFADDVSEEERIEEEKRSLTDKLVSSSILLCVYNSLDQ